MSVETAPWVRFCTYPLEITDLSLPEIDLDLSLTGFSVGEIDVVLADSPDPDDEAIRRCR